MCVCVCFIKCYKSWNITKCFDNFLFPFRGISTKIAYINPLWLYSKQKMFIIAERMAWRTSLWLLQHFNNRRKRIKWIKLFWKIVNTRNVVEDVGILVARSVTKSADFVLKVQFDPTNHYMNRAQELLNGVILNLWHRNERSNAPMEEHRRATTDQISRFCSMFSATTEPQCISSSYQKD